MGTPKNGFSKVLRKTLAEGKKIYRPGFKLSLPSYEQHLGIETEMPGGEQAYLNKCVLSAAYISQQYQAHKRERNTGKIDQTN